MARTSRRYNLLSACSAAVVWGAWSYFVNSAESTTTGLVAGLAQSLASFVMTLIVVLVVTRIYNSISHSSLQIVLPAVITVIGICLILVAVHALAGTPHIVFTIAPSLTVAFIFCVVTARALRRAEMTTQA